MLQSNAKTQLLLLPSVAKSSSALIPMVTLSTPSAALTNWALYFDQTFENDSDDLIELAKFF